MGGYEYSDEERLSELLSKVTDEQKLDIIPQTKSEFVWKMWRKQLDPDGTIRTTNNLISLFIFVDKGIKFLGEV